MRRVAREEAERLLRAAHADGVVRQVRVGDGADAGLLDEDESAFDTFEYEFDDGGVYVWAWARPESVRTGQHLWCTLPESGDVVHCVRAETILAEPEVLRTRRGTLRLVRSRFSRPQPAVVDASIIAPADLTQGTGLTEQDALLVLRTRTAALRRRGRLGIAGTFGFTAPMLQFVGIALDDPLVVAGVLGAFALPGLVATGWHLGPGQRRRRRLALAYVDGMLDPVRVVGWSGFGVTVETRDGRRWRWAVRPEYGSRLAVDAAAWATPVREGRPVALVGIAETTGRPVVIEAQSAAEQIRPPRSPVQDVVRGR